MTSRNDQDDCNIGYEEFVYISIITKLNVFRLNINIEKKVTYNL